MSYFFFYTLSHYLYATLFQCNSGVQSYILRSVRIYLQAKTRYLHIYTV